MRKHRAQTAGWWVIMSCCVVLVVVGAGWVVLRFTRTSVSITDVVEGPVVQAFYSTGTIQPQREYPIKSNTAGILRDIKVDKGTHVKSQEILATVEDPALVFAEQKAKAELEEKVRRADDKTSPVLQELDAKASAMTDMLQIAQREQK